tara:strand:+ start:428 stop:850 length:423 start_codon:yes stop_codon:yes gene_type:complete
MSDLQSAVTLVKDGIHNPSEPRHFMRVIECSNQVTATLDGLELANSRRALKVKEVGFDIYDTVFYFPREDVSMARLSKNEKTTHCPLKGDTEYFDIQTDDGQKENLAWSYDRTIGIADVIKNYIGFDTRGVQVTEYTAGS